MKYNVDHFKDLFNSFKADWTVGTLSFNGAHCALGHMGFDHESLANKNEETIALGDMLSSHIEKKYGFKMSMNEKKPGNIIPWINDTSTLNFVNKPGVELKGSGPKERFMELFDEIKQECLQNNGVKSKNREEAIPQESGLS